MNTLQKTKYTIYQIKHRNPFILNTYIGSTTDFKTRKAVHKLRTRNIESYNCSLYRTIRGLGGWENFEMIPIETIECETRTEAETREGYWIRVKTANMNTYMKTKTTRTSREKSSKYYQDNREKVLENIKARYNYVKIRRPEGALNEPQI